MDATSVSCDGGPTTTVVRGAVWLVASWVGVAVFCVVGNASLDLLADPMFHRQEYAIAERLAR
jgi:hypothetical protein